MAQGILPDWLQAIIMMALIASIIAFALQQAGELKKIQERARRKPKIIVEVVCNGKKEMKPYGEGDYVGKTIPCPSGEGTGTIIKIYAEEEQERQTGKTR